MRVSEKTSSRLFGEQPYLSLRVVLAGCLLVSCGPNRNK